jgi:hypothetical protein
MSDFERWSIQMTTEYKSMEFQVWRRKDGKWEWAIPELNIGGRDPDEARAVEEAKSFIDHWFERLH